MLYSESTQMMTVFSKIQYCGFKLQLDSVHLSFLFYIVEAPFRINGEGQFWFMSYALRLKSSNIVYIIIVKIGRLYLEIIILFGIISAHKK